MFNKFGFLLALAFLPSVALTQSESPFTYSVYFDAMMKESRLPRRQDSQLSQIRELSLGLGYQVQKELSLFIEASAEQFTDDSSAEFFVSQAYLTLDFRENYYFSSQVGQLFYPVGWLNELDNYFLNQPYYYSTLFPGKKGIDIGVIARLHPFKDDSFFLEGSCFEGRIFRASDQRSGRAEKRPCSISLRYQKDQLNLYYTHFEHDLAFYDKVKADGVGLQWTSPLQREFFAFGVWGEYWRITSSQSDGPTNLTEGGFFYPFMDLWRFRAAYRWAPVTNTVSYTSSGAVQSDIEDRLFRLEYRILEPLRLIYEDQQAKQKNGIALNDEWALRILLEL